MLPENENLEQLSDLTKVTKLDSDSSRDTQVSLAPCPSPINTVPVYHAAYRTPILQVNSSWSSISIQYQHFWDWSRARLTWKGVWELGNRVGLGGVQKYQSWGSPEEVVCLDWGQIRKWPMKGGEEMVKVRCKHSSPLCLGSAGNGLQFKSWKCFAEHWTRNQKLALV